MASNRLAHDSHSPNDVSALVSGYAPETRVLIAASRKALREAFPKIAEKTDLKGHQAHAGRCARGLETAQP